LSSAVFLLRQSGSWPILINMTPRPKILSVVGARPQFVKLAPLAEAMKGKFRHVIVHTGQHYDDNMSGLFFRQLKIPRPDINLKIGGGTHGRMTGRMLAALEQVLQREKPALVLVYGDTNSTLAGALAAAKLGLTVGHVEAGMRSFVSDMPEEINRRVSDHLSSLLFCPTSVAVANCRREGLERLVVLSGDLMYELLHRSRSVIRDNQAWLRKWRLEPGQFLLMTTHRAGNVDDRDNLRRLLDMVEQLPLPTILPLHPRTAARLRSARLMARLKRIQHLRLCEPLGHLDMLTAAYHARAVLTDSGGLQKEAVFLRTPVLTLREETEWPETLKRGNRLVGLDASRVLKSLDRLPVTKATGFRVGNRRPSQIIVSALTKEIARG